MRTLLLVGCLLLAFAGVAYPYSMVLQWEYPDAEMAKVTEFRVYNAATKTVIMTIPAPAKTATVMGLSGAFSCYVTAADPYLESAPSNTVSYQGIPSAPQNLTVKLVIEVITP